jgi:hypothetical protein
LRKDGAWRLLRVHAGIVTSVIAWRLCRSRCSVVAFHAPVRIMEIFSAIYIAAA